jgi:gliding motility-associated-like protein
MFGFKVGPADLNTADMDIDWPNGTNPFLGVCQNATTADHVAELNASIINCGYLVEPVGGVLPAESSVLMITSTDFCVTANSFAGLSDTLIIIFQCPGNYYGHFANYSIGGNTARTIEVDFGPGCDDEVTYQKDELVDQNGMNVAEDGATVNFTWAGVPTYSNFGCTAPVPQSIFDAGPNAVICPGEDISLAAIVENGVYSNLNWSGGLGTFSNPADPNATYFPHPDDADEFIIQLTADGCAGPVTDEITVFNLTADLTGISASPGATICDGQTVTLTAEGAGNTFQWDGGVVAQSIDVASAGTYAVSLTNGCGTVTEDIEIFVEDLPTVDMVSSMNQMVCDGDTINIVASGTGGDITWSTGAMGNTIPISEEGWYYATVQNDCAVVTDSAQLTISALPSVTIDPVGPVELCEGATVELTAAAVGNILWLTSQNTAVIEVSEPGIYEVSASNSCGVDFDQVEVIQGGSAPQAEITSSDDLVICPGESVQLVGSGDGAYTWNGQSSPASFDAGEAGLYTLIVTNDCGTDSESVEVVWDDLPLVELESNAYAICNGSSALISVDGNGPFYWSDGGVADENIFDSPGDYFVYSVANCGVDTAFFEVQEQGIQAEIDAFPLSGEAPLSVEFINETIGGQTVDWTFGDGELSSLDEVTHTFSEEGDYQVSMTVTSPLGCTSQTAVLISVGQCPFTLYLPTSFTPDGDGLNDQIRAVGECIELFEWHIYDRWGNEIFTSNEMNTPWNSTDSQGFAVLNGEYPYWLQVQDTNGETHRFSGSITVIR